MKPIKVPSPSAMPKKIPRFLTGNTLPIMVNQAGVATPAPKAPKPIAR